MLSHHKPLRPWRTQPYAFSPWPKVPKAGPGLGGKEPRKDMELVA